jgi:hypothetical protein
VLEGIAMNEKAVDVGPVDGPFAGMPDGAFSAAVAGRCEALDIGDL